MLLVYENKDKGISAEWKKTVHMPPHLHEAIEVVYVTNGNIALGVGMELYNICLLYTSPRPRDISGSRMPSSA